MNIDKMNEEKNDASLSGKDAEQETATAKTDVAARSEAPELPVSGEPDSVKDDGEPIAAAAEPVQEEPPKPGAQLAAIREAAGIEQEQVAASLKMTVRQVRELESDNYEALHGAAISRGFIRAYAKMLQVDPQPYVNMFAQDGPTAARRQLDQLPRKVSPERFTQGAQSFSRKRRPGKMIWLILIVLLVGLVYAAHAFKWLDSLGFGKKGAAPVSAVKQGRSRSVSSEIETPKVVMTEQQKDAAGTTPPVQGEKPGDAAPAQPADGKAEKVPAEDRGKEAEPAKEQKAPDATAEKEVAPAKDPEPARAAAAKEAPPAPQNFLVIRFRGATKVTLLKADASTLSAFEGRSGDVQKVEVNEPVTLVVDKAANVEVEFREQPLVLRPARRSEQARISLK